MMKNSSAVIDESPVCPSEYRKALGQFTTGVCIVTARDEDNQPIGLTVNSFTSVSLVPPLVLWCLSKTSMNLNAFLNAPAFSVAILAEDQRGLANHFAKPQRDRFANVTWTWSDAGLPIFEGTAATLECRTTETRQAGDHVIFLGEVMRLMSSQEPPLIYQAGTYRTLSKENNAS